MTNISDDIFDSLLPQPAAGQKYMYIPFDEITTTFFPNDDYPTDTLCWVLKSKGQKKKGNIDIDPSGRGDGVASDDDNCRNDDSSSGSRRRNGSGRRTELFLRARICDDEQTLPPETEYDDKGVERVTVRYPKGSTYRVRKSNLIPVIEKGIIQQNIVIVTSETCDYRRAAAVHTCIGESFLEIGCDFGPCVDRVRRVLTEIPGVRRRNEQMIRGLTDDDDDDDEKNGNRVVALGIDKSLESIDIAKQRYPKTLFSIEDALTKDGITKLRSLCKEKMVDDYPSVVAIDINGNRELPAVLDCLRNIMNLESDVDGGHALNHLPRLIIVKSRFLYEKVKTRRLE